MFIDVLLGIGEAGDQGRTYNLHLELRGRAYGARLYLENTPLETIARNVISLIEGQEIKDPTYKITWMDRKGQEEERITSNLLGLLYHGEILRRVYRTMMPIQPTELLH